MLIVRKGDKDMTTESQVTHVRVCFADNLMNADILVGTADPKEARRIARFWGEDTTGNPVTRAIVRGKEEPHRGPTTEVDGTTVWLPLF